MKKQYVQYKYFKKVTKNKGSYREWKRRVYTEIANKNRSQLDDLILYYEAQSIKVSEDNLDVVNFLSLCMQIILIPTTVILTIVPMVYTIYCSSTMEFCLRDNIDSESFMDVLNNVSLYIMGSVVDDIFYMAIIAFEFILVTIIIDNRSKNNVACKKQYYQKLIKLLKKERHQRK